MRKRFAMRQCWRHVPDVLVCLRSIAGDHVLHLRDFWVQQSAGVVLRAVTFPTDSSPRT